MSETINMRINFTEKRLKRAFVIYKIVTDSANDIIEHFNKPTTKRRLLRKPKTHFRK